MEPPPGQCFNRNGLAVNPDASLRWQIAESPHGTETDRPFMNLIINDHAELIAASWSGVQYRVNLGTGALTVIGLDR